MSIDNNKFWQAVLDKIKLEISKKNFNAWFKNTAIEFHENSAIIYVPNTFTKAWMKVKCHSLIRPIVKEISRGKVKRIYYKTKFGY